MACGVTKSIYFLSIVYNAVQAKSLHPATFLASHLDRIVFNKIC